MKPKRSNPLFAGFFRRNYLAAAVVVSLAGSMGQSARAASLYWDTNDTTTGSGNLGGSWDAGTTWSGDALGEATAVSWSDGNDAIFSAGNDGVGAWTVSIAGTVTTPLVKFEETGSKSITGGTINIGGGSINTASLGFGGADDITISSVLAGAGGLTIAAHGDATSNNGGGSGAELILGGTNTFSGGLTITSGIVSWTTDANLGDAGNAITLNGGGLLSHVGAGGTLSRNIVAGASGGTIRVYGSPNTLEHTGTLTGSGAMRRTDGGTLTMSGNGSGYSGTWNNRGGDTVFSSTNWAQMNLDSQSGGRVFFTNAGTSTINAANIGRDLFVDNGGRLDIDTGTLNLVTGAGFWIQTSNSGSLTTSSGTLTVTNGPASGNLATSVHDIRIPVVDFDGSTPLALVKNNVNDLGLYVANSYTGGTTINGGRISASNAASFGTGDVTVNNNGQAFVSGAGTFANNFIINGLGVAETAGTLGAIRFVNNTISGGINVASASRITAHTGATGTHTGTLSGSADLEINSTAANNNGTISFTGTTSGYTGTMTLSQGTLNVGALGGGLTLAAGTANVSGAVAGTTTLTTGTLNLNSGASIAAPVVNGGTINSKAGSTVTGGIATLNIATVNVGGSVSGGITLDSGDVLGLNGGTLAGDLNILSDATLNYSNTVAVTGNLDFQGTQTVNLNLIPTPGSTINLLTYTGTADDSGDSDLLGNFVLNNAANYRSVNFANTGSAITLTLGGESSTWVGGDGTNPTFWDTTTLNWSSTDQKFFNGDAVTFNDSATSTTVDMKTNVTPNSVTFNNTTKDYTVTGSAGYITGPTGITKGGTGTVTLGGANGQNYTGAIAVNSGTLKMGSRDAFGQTSGISVASGAVVDLNGQTPGSVSTGGYAYSIIGDGTGAGAITNTGAANYSNAGVKSLALTGNASIGCAGGIRFDIGAANTAGRGILDGNGFTLTKKGAGEIGFRGTGSGDAINIVVEGGTVWAEDDDTAFGGAAGNITVKTGARCGTYSNRTIATPITVENGGTLHVQGNTGTGTWSGAVTLNDGATVEAGGALFFSGTATHTGTGALAKTGGNQLTITGSLVGSGGTLNHNAGTIQIGNVGATGSFSGFPTVNVGAGLLFRNRLSGANNTITSNFNFSSSSSELRQHSGVATDTLTLTGTIGTSTANGILRSTFGRILLSSGANATVNMLSLQGAPASGPGTITVGTGASLTSPWFNIGDGGSTSGIVNISGGTATVPSGSNGTRIGHWNNNSSTVPSELNVVEGIYDASATNVQTSVGWDGYGIMTVGGGANPATAKVWKIQADANGDSTTYSDTITLLANGTLEVGAGGTASVNTTTTTDRMILSGGTISGKASSTWACPWLVSSDSGVSVDSGFTATQTGQINGTGNLTKTGDGTLKLSLGSGTYTGTVDTQAGITELGASFAGTDFTASGTGKVYLGSNTTQDLVVTSGGSIQPGNASGVGSATATSLDLDGGNATFRIGTSGDLLTAPSLTVTSASTISVIPANALTAPSSFTLIDYDGVIGGLGIGGLTLNSSNPHYSATLMDDTINTEVYVDITAADSVVWKGNVNGNWDVNSTSNWVLASDGVTSDKFYDFDVVELSDLGIGTPTLTLTGTIKPAALSVSNTSGTYTLQGSGLTGGSNLAKSGAGSLVLLNNNANTGVVSITGGSVTVGNGGTSGLLGGSGGITLSTGTSLAFNRSDAQTITRAITGGGTLYSNGGNFTLNAAGNACDIVVNSGTFFARGGGFSAAFDAGKLITVNTGAILDTVTHSMGSSVGGGGDVPMVSLNGGSWNLNNEQYMRTLTMNQGTAYGTGEIRTLSGGSVYTVVAAANPSTISCGINMVYAATMTVNDGAAANDLLITGSIGNSGALTKSGAGTMVIAGNNTSTGAVTISGGTLQIGNGSTTGVLGTGNVTDNANLSFKRSDALAVANVISGTGTVTQAGAGTTTLSGVNTYTGNTTVSAGTLNLADNAQLKFVIGANGVNNKITGAGALEVAGDFNLDLSGADITDGNSWTLVDVGTLSETFLSSFTIPGFTESANVHTMVDGDNTWTFTEATGVLSLSVAGGYSTWASTNAPSGTAGDDYDGDGVPNGVEYVLGGTAGTNDLDKMPTVSTSGGNLIFTFKRDQDSKTADTAVKVEVGTTLASWPNAYSVPDSGTLGPVTVTDNLDGTDTVTLTVAMSPDAAKFARLRVDITP